MGRGRKIGSEHSAQERRGIGAQPGPFQGFQSVTAVPLNARMVPKTAGRACSSATGAGQCDPAIKVIGSTWLFCNGRGNEDCPFALNIAGRETVVNRYSSWRPARARV